ncbi:MAG: hypothetical protein ACRCXZ_04285 [Patescibacteria group bacterium]
MEIGSLSLVLHHQVINNASIAGVEGCIRLFGLNIDIPCIYQLCEGDPKVKLLEGFINVNKDNMGDKNRILSFKKNEILRVSTRLKYNQPPMENTTLFYIIDKDCFVQLYAPLFYLIN